jgi:Xaa-Pro aminopeptidase
MREPAGASRTLRSGLLALIFLSMLAYLTAPLAAREREPNSVYAERRARLAAELKEPVLLFGYTGRENSSPAYVFLQEPNFYYLTGHNEEGAALLLVPASAADKGLKGPNEILFLPPRNPEEEKWNGPRMAPTDTDVHEKDRLFQRRSLLDSKSAPHRVDPKLP